MLKLLHWLKSTLTPKTAKKLEKQKRRGEMEKVYLHRIREDGIVTLGVLVYNNLPICVTLEEPDLDNQVGISNIPEGAYITHTHQSPKFGDTWWIKNVPNRSEILIHAGNTTKDTRGCVLLGTQFGKYIGNRPSIMSSRKAMRKAKQLLPDTFELVITNMADS